MSKFTLITALCILVLTSTGPDTLGTEFVFVYPPNNSGSKRTNVTLDITNVNTRNVALVTIQYNEYSGDSHNITSVSHITVLKVNVFSNIVFAFSGSVTLDNIKNGLHSYTDNRIFINSTIPITLLARNLDISGTRDTFLVLPTSMADKQYAVMLPSSATDGATIAYLLPIQKNFENQQFTVEITNKASTCSFSHTLKAGKILAYSTSAESFTLRAQSSTEFVMVLAVRKLPVKKGSDKFDFGCFMPTAIPSSGCDKLAMPDDHIIQLLTGKYYLLATPSADCDSVDITIRSRKQSKSIQLAISDFSKGSKILSLKHSGNMAAISTMVFPLNVVRYGGYNIGDLNYEEGAYLYEVPTTSQFVTGLTTFVVDDDSNQITIIANYPAVSSTYFDGENTVTFAPLPFFNETWYYASGTVQPGFHFLHSMGSYITYITGRINNTAYGYVSALNSRKAIKPVSTASWDFAMKPVSTSVFTSTLQANSTSLTTTTIYSTPATYRLRTSENSIPISNLFPAVKFGDGISEMPFDARVNISASAPVGVAVINFGDRNGDIFTALPTTMAGNNYAFTLPSPGSLGFSTAYFSAVTEDAKISITIFDNGRYEEYTRLIRVTEGSNTLFYSKRNGFTLFATSNAPFLITVGVEGLLVADYGEEIADFGSFMPMPLSTTECSQAVDHKYPLMLFSAQSFLISPPSPKCVPSIRFFGISDKNFSRDLHLSKQSDTIQKLDSNVYGNSVALFSNTAISVIRYGGYNMTLPQLSSGTFLDQIVSWDNFVTGRIPVSIHDTFSSITVIGDELTKNSVNLNWYPVQYFGEPAYISVFNADQSFFFENPGRFIIYVSASVEVSDGLSSAFGYAVGYGRNVPESKGGIGIGYSITLIIVTIFSQLLLL
ncbi:unnamed protein product [Thelazia callipaeda]|uniref:IgGFc_binding domain-containing protein n=1 Tax=Thelazia callipaeda TaxID=103827 RepID=A0A0N5D596_THECL|nr:unnamed protein product [Thelazia callipaeda]